MDEDFSEISDEISKAFEKRAKRFHLSSILVKAVLVAGAAAIAAICQFVAWNADQSPTTSQIVGIVSSVVVFFGGLFVVFTESDASKELALAQSSIATADAFKRKTAWISELDAAYERIIELSSASSTMRRLAQESTVASVGDDAQLAMKFLDLAGRSLSIAAGFEQNDRWTICIYQAKPIVTTGEIELKLVAHHRAIRCEIDGARAWPSGVGVAGMAYFKGKEQIIPDMSDPLLQNLLGSSGMGRPNDDERYKSMAAYPIFSSGRDLPWGVASATNDRVGHFNHEETQFIKNDEPIEVLAEFLALAISIREAHTRHAVPSVPSTTA